MEAKKKTNTKKIVIGVVILAVVIALLAVLYVKFGPSASKGAKEITIEVVDDQGESTTYTVDTDAEVLRQVMEDAEEEGFTFGGTESDYGLMVETVNDVYADYVKDGAYWSILVDGEYCNYGVDVQTVEDGQTYSFVYSIN